MLYVIVQSLRTGRWHYLAIQNVTDEGLMTCRASLTGFFTPEAAAATAEELGYERWEG